MKITHDTRTEVVSATVKKYIQGFTHVLDRNINIFIGTVGSNEIELITVDGDEYTELMGASPTWAPGKREGTFRVDDLWTFVDRKKTVTSKAEVEL